MDSGLSLSNTGMVTEAGFDDPEDFGFQPDNEIPLNPGMTGGWAQDLARRGPRADPGRVPQDRVMMSPQPGNEPADLSDYLTQTDNGSAGVDAQPPDPQAGGCAASPAELLAIEAQHADAMNRQRVMTYGAAAAAFVGGWLLARFLTKENGGS